jgi:hypothetical protein
VTAGRYRWLILAGAIAMLVVLFAVLRNGDDNEASTNTTPATTAATTGATTTVETTEPPATTAAEQPTVVRVVVRGGKVVGGPQVHDVPFQKKVTLIVRSNIADEVHVHGYNLMRDVAPGMPVRLTFVTTLSGRFEFELEDAHLRLGELSVAPS